MNVDDVKSNVRNTTNRIKANMPRRGVLAAVGGLPFLLGAILVALRFDYVRQGLYKMIPQSRNFVDRMYGANIDRGMNKNLNVGAGGRNTSGPTHERTTYGEA
jgi:hypothetical protein